MSKLTLQPSGKARIQIQAVCFSTYIINSYAMLFPNHAKNLHAMHCMKYCMKPCNGVKLYTLLLSIVIILFYFLEFQCCNGLQNYSSLISSFYG